MPLLDGGVNQGAILPVVVYLGNQFCLVKVTYLKAQVRTYPCWKLTIPPCGLT